MAAPKTSNRSERAARLEAVSRMYLQKHTMAAIAVELGVTRQQIGYDLKAIRKQWLKSAVRDFDLTKSQELAKLVALEETHWEAWRKSVETKTITTKSTEKAGNGKRSKMSVRSQESSGDPRFLAGIYKCIERRCQLLGLDAPIKSELTGKDGEPLFSKKAESLTDEELVAIIEQG